MSVEAQTQVEPQEPQRPAFKGDQLIALNSAIFKDVKVALQAKLGAATVSVEDLLGLKSGSVLKLDTKLGQPVELRLNESIVALGEIVAVGDSFGVRIVNVAPVK